MTAYSVDLDELASVIAELDTFQKSIQDKMVRLDRLVTDLHLTWAGEAATAQARAHQTWMAGAAEMHEGLVTMHQGATVAHDNYRSAADSNRDTFRQTR